MENPPIIIDNGTGYVKIGYSFDDKPRANFPSLVGRPLLRFSEKIEDIELKPLMIGDEVLPVRSLLELSHPVNEGIITNLADMELIWEYGLTKKLNFDLNKASSTSILLTEAPRNPNANKISMAELVFEKFGFNRFNIEPQAKLSLICEGLETGIVLDSGDGVTHSIPVWQNYIVNKSILKMKIAGRHVTDRFIKLLQFKGYALNSSSDFETAREIKEQMCFVSSNIKQDRKLNSETTFYNDYYKLPDGRSILLNSEKFEAPEILFSPYLINSEEEGVSNLVFNSINVTA